MPHLNVEEETEVIRDLLETSFFIRDRSTNSAEDYESSGKAERDMRYNRYRILRSHIRKLSLDLPRPPAFKGKGKSDHQRKG